MNLWSCSYHYGFSLSVSRTSFVTSCVANHQINSDCSAVCDLCGTLEFFSVSPGMFGRFIIEKKIFVR